MKNSSTIFGGILNTTTEKPNTSLFGGLNNNSDKNSFSIFVGGVNNTNDKVTPTLFGGLNNNSDKNNSSLFSGQTLSANKNSTSLFGGANSNSEKSNTSLFGQQNSATDKNAIPTVFGVPINKLNLPGFTKNDNQALFSNNTNSNDGGKINLIPTNNNVDKNVNNESLNSADNSSNYIQGSKSLMNKTNPFLIQPTTQNNNNLFPNISKGM